MKKFLSVALVCLMVISVFAACGKENQTSEPDTTSAVQDTTTEAVPEESTSISKDYRSGQIMIDGSLITLPMKASELIALGWTPDDYDAGYTIEAKSDIRTGEWESYLRCDFAKGNNELDCSVYNWTDTDIALSDGYIEFIITDDDSNYSVVIPGNFEVGKATKDEIVSKWGEPEDTGSVNDEEYEIEYEIDDYSGYELYFWNETNILSGVQVYNANKTSEMSSPNKVYKVNLDAAADIKSRDSFEVKVSDMQIVEGALNTGNINFSGNDAFVITFSNDGDKDINDVAFLIVAYKESGELVKVKSTNSVPDYREDQYISIFESEDDMNLKAGESNKLYIQCDASQYYGAQAIVLSYTDADGSEHENPMAQEWFNSIYDR